MSGDFRNVHLDKAVRNTMVVMALAAFLAIGLTAGGEEETSPASPTPGAAVASSDDLNESAPPPLPPPRPSPTVPSDPPVEQPSKWVAVGAAAAVGLIAVVLVGIVDLMRK